MKDVEIRGFLGGFARFIRSGLGIVDARSQVELRPSLPAGICFTIVCDNPTETELLRRSSKIKKMAAHSECECTVLIS